MSSAARGVLDAAPSARSHRRWQTWSIAFVLILAPMALWALASPLMSIPDEPAHAIRAAAVVRGEVRAPAWQENLTMMSATVPASVAFTHNRACFAFQPDVSASCVAELTGDPDALVTTGTSAGLNSPVYYAIVGLPTLILSGDAALYGMRLFNAILCAAVLAVMVMQLRMLERSRWALTAAFVSITPMVLYLGGAINPNGLELASAGALFATLVGTFRATSGARVLWERAGITALCTMLLLSTRSISLLWVLVVLGAALLLGRREVFRSLLKRPAAWAAVGGSALASVVTLSWFLTPPTTASSPAAGVPALDAFALMLLRTFDYLKDMVGLFGWVDTPAPTFAIIAWSLAAGALIISAAAWGRGLPRLVVGLLAAVVILTPAIVQATLAPELGYIWQARYVLAMVVCLLVACGIAIDASMDVAPSPSLSRAISAVFVLLAAAHIASFMVALHRYVNGTASSLRDFLLAPEWQPPLTWPGLSALFIVAIGVGTLVLWRDVSQGVREIKALESSFDVDAAPTPVGAAPGTPEASATGAAASVI